MCCPCCCNNTTSNCFHCRTGSYYYSPPTYSSLEEYYARYYPSSKTMQHSVCSNRPWYSRGYETGTTSITLPSYSRKCDGTEFGTNKDEKCEFLDRGTFYLCRYCQHTFNKA